MLLSVVASVWALVATAYVLLYQTVNALMLVGAGREIRRQRRSWPRGVLDAALASGECPGVSVVIPAFNESKSIVRTVQSALALAYPDFEVIVVNDGSKDRTLTEVWDQFDLLPSNRRSRQAIPTQHVRAVFTSRRSPQLTVVDKRNGGKADALNAGINLASKPLVCAIDADVVLDRTALQFLVMPFILDSTTVASSGMIRLINGSEVGPDGSIRPGMPRRWLERFQFLEFIRSFCLGRLFFNRWNAHLIISGAFGLFSRQLLVDLGGYQPNAIGEDMEIVVRAHRHLLQRHIPYRCVYVADAVVYTEAPGSVSDLGKQRTRWHQGLLTSLRLHRRMMLRLAFGAVGLIAFPYFVIFELASPVIEVLGWLSLPALALMGKLSVVAMLPFMIASTLLATAVSLAAILVESAAFASLPTLGDRATLVVVALLEPFGYHFLSLYYRLRAFPRYYRGVHLRGGWVSPMRGAGG